MYRYEYKKIQSCTREQCEACKRSCWCAFPASNPGRSSRGRCIRVVIGSSAAMQMLTDTLLAINFKLGVALCIVPVFGFALIMASSVPKQPIQYKPLYYSTLAKIPPETTCFKHTHFVYF